jgi:prevent-host-death family protein
MSKVSTSTVRRDFAEVLNRVAYAKERIVLQRHGKDVAAVVPIEDLKLLEDLEDKIDAKLAKKARKEADLKGTIPWEQIKKQYGL